MELSEKLHEERWFGNSLFVGASVTCGGEKPLNEALPTKGWAHLDAQMRWPIAYIPSRVPGPRRSHDDLTTARSSFDAIDLKANAPIHHFPAFLHLGMDVFATEGAVSSPVNGCQPHR